MLELISKFTNPAGNTMTGLKAETDKNMAGLSDSNGFAGKLAALLSGFSESGESNIDTGEEGGFSQMQMISNAQSDLKSEKVQITSENQVLPEGEEQLKVVDQNKVQIQAEKLNGFTTEEVNKNSLQRTQLSGIVEGDDGQNIKPGIIKETGAGGSVLKGDASSDLKPVNLFLGQGEDMKQAANSEKAAAVISNLEKAQFKQGAIQTGMKQTVANRAENKTESKVFIPESHGGEVKKQVKQAEINQAAIRIEKSMVAEGLKNSGHSTSFNLQNEVVRNAVKNTEFATKTEPSKSGRRQQGEFQAVAGAEKGEPRQEISRNGFKNIRIPVQESRPEVNKSSQMNLPDNGMQQVKASEVPEAELSQNKDIKSTEAADVNRTRNHESQAIRNDSPVIFQASGRRSLSVRLAQIVKQELQHARTDQNGWQKHQFMFDDGTKIQLSLRKADGVVQLQLGSANSEMNRLIQQHANEIRQYLEEQMDLDVNLQFMESENDGGQYSPESKKSSEASGLNPSNSPDENGDGPKLQPGVRSARYFGFNNNEWTA